MGKGKISRRTFLIRGGLSTIGVLAVGTYVFRNALRRKALKFVDTTDALYVGNTNDPMLWFEITKNNTIILHSPKVEMGQGIFTGLAQMAADELEISMDQIKVVHASTDSGNIDGLSTGGSLSIAGLWHPLRELAAVTREIIKAEAAAKLGVEMRYLTVSNGTLTANGKTMSYAEVMEGVTEWTLPEVSPTLKQLKDYRFIGKPIPRIDLYDKVFGKPIFGMDAEMPNMLYGAVVRPDRIGATFIDADTSDAEQMPGVVQIVKESDFVGVIAHSYMEAENAKNAIKVNWKVERHWQSKDIEDLIKVGNGRSQIIQKEGNSDKVLQEDDVLTMAFTSPIGAHAQLEPNGVVASVEADRATIIISTQVVGITRKEVAECLGFREEQVTIIPTYLGGGFGRRLHTPHAMQAALMSKAIGKPIKYFFNRKEEFQNDMFRPPTHHILKAKLNDDGLIEAIEHQVSSGDVAHNSPILPHFVLPLIGADIGAIRGAYIRYSRIPNQKVVSWHVDLPFATSWWRSLGLLANTFAIESFMDELTIRSGKNPVHFRLEQIHDDEAGQRLKAVIKAAVKTSGYQDEVRNGRAMGFAASVDSGTPCAQVVEVSIDDNHIKVHKVTCALDPGVVVNPDQVRAQCEGAIIMGLSASLYERMYVKDGALYPTVYGPYEMALMRHAPKDIDVVLLQGMDDAGPVGEPPLGPIGAAIGNALRRLTGRRYRNLPLSLV
ncbi:xanthine dehydrogenase family protein molybdopterin-binding subunit [Aestuariivivens sediminis]|uniref:xanthine dehydrogenase family protein molybdopterin-binding subunit n=1 Tax=Aestuariivivens sediminis TaxID=2913557 RepID=UPI001F569592|nr:molybdopterin cofactor-binding domain-containing protein [Aestuariivivens sediminis]